MSPPDWCSEDDALSQGSEDSGNEGDDRQLIGLAAASSLCSLGMRPLVLTGFFRDALGRHFGDPDSIEQPELRKLVWRPGTDTAILIESIFRSRPELANFRPAILIKRNAYQNVRIGINDWVGVDQQGDDIFTTFWVGSHTLFCIHDKGAAAELLATEVQRELTQFGPRFCVALMLKKLRVTQVGAISELVEFDENYVVPITVGWAYQESWKVEYEARPLRIRLSSICGFEL